MPEFDNEQLNLNPEELQSQIYKSEEAVGSAISEELEAKTPEGLEELKAELEQITEELDAEDLDKRNYVKVSPTFYIRSVENEDEDDETELFKILNPVEGTVETRELTDDEKKELLVTQLKMSRQKFQPLSHPTKTVGTETVVTSIGREKKVTSYDLLNIFNYLIFPLFSRESSFYTITFSFNIVLKSRVLIHIFTMFSYCVSFISSSFINLFMAIINYTCF